MAPSLGLRFDADELPFSVKVEKKVNIRDVAQLYKTTYDGTEFEMIRHLKVEKKQRDKNGKLQVVDTIVSPAAHPWLSTDRRNLLNALQNRI